MFGEKANRFLGATDTRAGSLSTAMRKLAPGISGAFEGKTSQNTRSELTEACTKSKSSRLNGKPVSLCDDSANTLIASQKATCAVDASGFLFGDDQRSIVLSLVDEILANWREA